MLLRTSSTSHQAIKQRIEANQSVKLVGMPEREYQSETVKSDFWKREEDKKNQAQFHKRTIIHIFKENPNPILSKKSIIKQPKFINPNHPILSRKSTIKTWILIIKQPKFINLFIGLKKKKKSPNHYKVYKLWLHPQA